MQTFHEEWSLMTTPILGSSCNGLNINVHCPLVGDLEGDAHAPTIRTPPAIDSPSAQSALDTP